MAPEDRDDLLHLFERLGSRDDAEVLAAARALHARVHEAGLTWEDLIPSVRRADEDQDELADEEAHALEDHPGFEPDLGAEGGVAGPDDGEMIRALLARGDLSDETRAEIAGFEADLRSGALDPGDRRYLRALHRRLAGGNQVTAPRRD
jgi:hypothetical protein